MDYTELKIHSYSVTSGVDDVAYRVEVTVDIKGELPHTQIFVYSIAAAEDASKDTFLRIATTTDLKSGFVDRETAVRAKEKLYATSFLFRENADLDTIVALKTELVSRINTLIQTWVAYRDSFIVDDMETKILPSGSPTQQEQLVQNYKTAKSARIAKEKEVDVINASLSTTTEALTTARAIKNTTVGYALSLTAAMQTLDSKYLAYVALIETEGSTAVTYRGSNLTPASKYLDTLAGELANNITSTTQDIAAMESALATQSTTRIMLVSELRALQIAEDNALSDLVEAFPDVDPTAL